MSQAASDLSARPFWKRHWFLLSLLVLFSVGFVASEELEPLTQLTGLREGLVFAVMFCAGVTLPLAAVRRSVARPLAVGLAVGLNIAAVPLATVGLAYLLAPQWYGGLMVASLMPCTLASAAVWTRKAGGDDSIALITTVVTNLACVAVIPAGLWLLGDFSAAGDGAGGVMGPVTAADFGPAVGLGEARIDASGQVVKLSLLVVAPLLLAQLVRVGGAADWADRQKKRLGVLAQLGILTMVMFGAVASGQRVGSFGETWPPLWKWVFSGGQLLLVVSAAHLAVLWIGVATSRWAGRDRDAQIAVGMAGSQKTLMVGLQTAIDCGVSVVPMIVYHVAQLVWDTLIAERWAARSAGDASQ